MSPHLAALQQALQQHALIWLCAPDGYDQKQLCQQLQQHADAVATWPAPPHHDQMLVIPCLDALSEAEQQRFVSWLESQRPRPGLCLICSSPAAPLEGALRAAGWHPQRWGAQRLQWDGPALASWWQQHGIADKDANAWLPRLGHWPLAWQLRWQAQQCDGNAEQLLQRWGLDIIRRHLEPLPLPLQQALALLAGHDPLDEPRLLQLSGCTRGQWRPLRQGLLDAGWLLETATGDHWQPWIAELLAIWREQPELDWDILAQLLAELPLTEIVNRLPDAPLPQLELALLGRIGLRCIEQSQGRWLAKRLAALPMLWLQQQPTLCLLQAWLEVEVMRRSERAEVLLNRLLEQPLAEETDKSARLLKAMVSFSFDHMTCAGEQLAELEELPQPLLAPYRLTHASYLLYNGDLPRARGMLELLISWADCQLQYHTKLVGWYRLAQLYFYQGDWQLCSKTAQLGLEFANQQQLMDDPIFEAYYRLLAELALHQGKADEADYWLQQGTPHAEPLGNYWQLPYLAHRCLTLIWRGEVSELATRLEQLEQQRFGQQYCRLWPFRVGYTLALGYQQRGDLAAMQRLLQRTPWHNQIDTLYDLLDNLLVGWLSQMSGTPKPLRELQPLQQLAEEWQADWLAHQFALLQLLQQASDPERWQALLAWFAGRGALLPLLLAGPKAVAPLQEVARWPQTRPPVLALVQQALDWLTRPLQSPSAQPDNGELSQRQWQILRLIAQGLSNEQMARQLFVAPSTIKTHINHLYAKLGVRTRAEAQAIARQKLMAM